MASLDLVRGRRQAALHWANLALQRAPYDVSANILRLRSLAADSAVAAAELEVAANKAAAETDDELAVLNEGASLLVARNGLPEARRVLKRAEAAEAPPIETDDLAFGPDFPHGQASMALERARTHHLLGYCLAQAGEFEKAVGFARRAIAADTLMVEAYVNLYAGYRSMGRLVEADSVLTDAARRFPNHPLIAQLLAP
jgi:tetratricopeptide (TPR) repeat protein